MKKPRKVNSPKIDGFYRGLYQQEWHPHPIGGPGPDAMDGTGLDYTDDCQAKRVIRRFGGVNSLIHYMRLAGIQRTRESIYYWITSGGLIPPNGVRDVFVAEVQAGIRLTDADWSPYSREEALEAPEDASVEATKPPGRLVL